MRTVTLLLVCLFCSACPSVRLPNRLVFEPFVSVEYWDAGDSALSDDIVVGKFGGTFREDHTRSVSEVPTHPGFLDRHDAALAREAEAPTAGPGDDAVEPDTEVPASDSTQEDEGEGAQNEVDGLLTSAELGLQLVEQAAWATIWKLLILLTGLAAITLGLYFGRRWWLKRSA